MTLLSFFLCTFALTWSLWLACATAGGGGVVALGGPVFLVGGFAPSVVAIALTAWSDGRTGVFHLLARIGRRHVRLRWYVLAVGYVAALKLTAALILRVATGTWPTFGDTPWPLMAAAIAFSTWVQAGEEVGWRRAPATHAALRARPRQPAARCDLGDVAPAALLHQRHRKRRAVFSALP